MTNVSPWIIRTLTFPQFSSLYGTVHCPFSPQELVQTSPASKPRDMVLSITHNPPYIFLKTATIPTYYGISIAIPRYIAMQLSTVSVYYDTLHHCHIALNDHVVDIVFVAKPPFIILSYMSLVSHCISRYTAGGIHIESYYVLSIKL